MEEKTLKNYFKSSKRFECADGQFKILCLGHIHPISYGFGHLSLSAVVH